MFITPLLPSILKLSGGVRAHLVLVPSPFPHHSVGLWNPAQLPPGRCSLSGFDSLSTGEKYSYLCFFYLHIYINIYVFTYQPICLSVFYFPIYLFHFTSILFCLWYALVFLHIGVTYLHDLFVFSYFHYIILYFTEILIFVFILLSVIWCSPYWIDL